MNKSILIFLYGIKRFLIITLAALLIACVEIAPIHPIPFLLLALAYIISIRLIWRSVLADEKILAKDVPRIKKKADFNCRKQSNRAA